MLFILHSIAAQNLTYFQYLLAREAFEKGDDDEREWMLGVMYESHRKFYSESVHVVYMVSL